MSLPNTILSVQEIVNRYLYNSPTTPINKVDEGFIRGPKAQGTGVIVDANAYMAEVGRFALGSMSDLVKKFFSWVGEIPDLQVGKEYSKADIIPILGLGKLSSGVVFQQYSYDDGRNDYAERSFIWNSSAFKLGDDIKFVVEQDSQGHLVRKIKNFYIEPDKNKLDGSVDNFDFDTNNATFNLFVRYLKAYMDPSEIGRKVLINVSGTVTSRMDAYTFENYQQDIQHENDWKVSSNLGGFIPATLPPYQLWAGPVSGLVSSAIGAAQMFVKPKDSFYFDNLMPWIQYKMDLTKGRQDMLVINVFDTLWNGLFDAIPNPDAGVMRIKNFDFVGSYVGWQQSSLANQGTFGMVFKKVNPIWAVNVGYNDNHINKRAAA